MFAVLNRDAGWWIMLLDASPENIRGPFPCRRDAELNRPKIVGSPREPYRHGYMPGVPGGRHCIVREPV